MSAAPFAFAPRVAVTLSVGVLLLACDKATAPPRPASLTAQGTTILTGAAGDASAPLRVQVISDRGSPLAGAVVGCAIVEGGGSLASSQATSDESGIASCGAWTFAQQPGTGVAVVTHPGLDTVRFTATITAGPPATVVLERALPASLRSGLPVTPQPIAILHDRFGNIAARANILVTASTATAGVTLSGAQVATDATGRARFSQLCAAGGAGTAAVTFGAPGLTAAQNSVVLEAEPPGGTHTLEFGTPETKVIVVDVGVRAFFPPTVLRDGAGLALCGDNPAYLARSPSLLQLDGATGLAQSAGRTFVVANSGQYPEASDSILIHVAATAGGPLLLTDLTTFALTSGSSYDVRILIDPRAAGAITAVTMDVAYPLSSPGLLTLQSVTAATGTTATASTLAGIVRLTYVNATGVTAVTEIARLRFRANTASPNFSQIVLVPLQVVSATLQDVTATTAAINPPFVVRQ